MPDTAPPINSFFKEERGEVATGGKKSECRHSFEAGVPVSAPFLRILGVPGEVDDDVVDKSMVDTSSDARVEARGSLIRLDFASF